ncbi:DUF4388 domain-containing protein [candidate division WOR-3 bacterium]|uniref:DUF4388 domain-containing protein n=1 Tax=candidate division WOR-3 bacterium TaxID=2052148 RepID=A0A9D5QCY6_UNCW3|nr:DUF4388 domain-containing protein [candidate division WOR-3 bacterium]MBD3364542.1 DUF4388 domain-containing protein [candidate division WOR-3 bacterium]
MLEGKIERQGFLDIIQLLAMSQKTGRLEISGDIDGSLFFKQGELLDCHTGKLVGDEAFIELFILVSGSFKFFDEGVTLNKRITKSLTDLLSEASQRATEWDKVHSEVPCEDAALVLIPVDPEAENSYQVGAMDWAIVSQVNGRRSFPDIARLLGQSKTKVGITIANLKKKGLIATEDEESAQLRSVFRKTAELLRHLIYSRVKQKRNRERIYTEFNKWNFSKGWDIRILGDGEVVENETPYDLPLKEKSDAYKQSLEQMYEAARSGLNQTELQDHLSDLFERLSKEERKLVKKHSLSKLLSSSRKVDEAGEIWDSGSEGILPR